MDSLKQEIAQLPHLHAVAFAASVCERMLPMYNKFSQMEKWGRPSLLREALDEVWLILQEKPTDLSKIRQLIEELDGENVCPDSESDYFCDAPYLFEAQFTISAIYCTLKAIITADFGYIIGVVDTARFETIDGFISQKDKLYQVKDRQYVMESIATDPLAKQEMAKEMEDLERLKNDDKLSPTLLDWLRTTSNGKSIIKLSEA